MNKSFDELESELRSLRPNAPSDRVRRGITEQLSATPQTGMKNNAWVWGAVAVAIAAAVTFAIVSWPGPDEIHPPGHGVPIVDQSPDVKPPTDVKPPPDVDTPIEMHLPPTWLAYRHRLNESVESLDELLDEHANSLLAGDPSTADTDLLFDEVYQN